MVTYKIAVHSMLTCVTVTKITRDMYMITQQNTETVERLLQLNRYSTICHITVVDMKNIFCSYCNYISC